MPSDIHHFSLEQWGQGSSCIWGVIRWLRGAAGTFLGVRGFRMQTVPVVGCSEQPFSILQHGHVHIVERIFFTLTITELIIKGS